MLLKSQKWSHCSQYVRRAESSRHLWEKVSKPFSLTQINKREGTWRPHRYLICHQNKCYLGWLSGPLQIQIYFLVMRSLDSESLWEEYIWASNSISWYHGNTSKSFRKKTSVWRPNFYLKTQLPWIQQIQHITDVKGLAIHRYLLGQRKL